jgi:hypothetical protein
MFAISKSWKEFRANLSDLHIWMQANAGDKYCGMSADYQLTLHFNEEPSEEIKTAIDAKWDIMDETEETEKFVHAENLEKAVEAAKTAILTADFASMIAAERGDAF